MTTQEQSVQSNEAREAAALHFKADIRRGTATAIGAKIEEMHDSAEKRAAEFCGAKKALQAHVKNLLGIMEAVDEEVQKSIPDLETAKLVKDWLIKTVRSTESLAGHMLNSELQALGEVAALKSVHTYVQKVVGEIDSSKAALDQAIASGNVQLEEDGTAQQVGDGPRLPGIRPSMSIAQQRKAEEEPPRKGRRSKKS